MAACPGRIAARLQAVAGNSSHFDPLPPICHHNYTREVGGNKWSEAKVLLKSVTGCRKKSKTQLRSSGTAWFKKRRFRVTPNGPSSWYSEQEDDRAETDQFLGFCHNALYCMIYRCESQL